MTLPVEKGRAMDMICLDSCKVFDTVLATKLMRYGFGGCTVGWIRNWLDVHVQNVADNHTISKWKPETHGGS